MLERPIAWDGVPFVMVDTAGLRDSTDDTIEAIGIERARKALDQADIVLWLGEAGAGPAGVIDIATKADLVQASADDGRVRVSAVTGEVVDDLRRKLVEMAADLLPKPNETALNERQRSALEPARNALRAIDDGLDLLIVAENLRVARVAFDRFTGRASSEDVLDRLFSRFCIGK